MPIARFKSAAREHRLPRRVRRPLLQRAAPAGAQARSNCALSSHTVEVFAGTQRVAVHAYSAAGAHDAARAHAGVAPRASASGAPAKLIAWGERIGAACAAVVRWQMEHRPHPEQGYRACLGLQRLARSYGPERLEAACARALSIRSPTYKTRDFDPGRRLDRPPLKPEPTPNRRCRCTTTCAAPTTTTDPTIHEEGEPPCSQHTLDQLQAAAPGRHAGRAGRPGHQQRRGKAPFDERLNAAGAARDRLARRASGSPGC
jgi:hypothetical protein